VALKADKDCAVPGEMGLLGATKYWRTKEGPR
jgi:hypothetical protein